MDVSASVVHIVVFFVVAQVWDFSKHCSRSNSLKMNFVFESIHSIAIHILLKEFVVGLDFFPGF